MQPEPHRPIQAAVETSRTNWAGNYTYKSAHLVDVASLAEVEQLLATGKQVKPVGTRHSFNHIADTSDTQLNLSALKSMTLDSAAGTVKVGAGVTYGELAPFLAVRGYALHNLASLPHISVVGACATGTHGSGMGNGCLTTAVSAMELLKADGSTLTLNRANDLATFQLAAVGLGALGVITSLSLELVPAYQIAQTVYEGLSFHQLERNLHEIFSAAYSVSLFTDWQNGQATQVWLKRRLAAGADPAFPDTFFGARKQTAKLHPLPNMSAENCTAQLGEPGPWFDRLPHFRLDYTPSAGAELQTEYFVPIENGYDAIRAVEELRDRITPHLLVSELRAIAADDLAMSMCFGRPSLALHFTWKQETEAVLALLPAIEARLAPFAARPHWAKLFTMAPDTIRSLYPRFDEFRTLKQQLDPSGIFRNEFLDALFLS